MTVKTTGNTIWHRLPHPAHPKSNATIDVVVSEEFWRRIAQHIEEEPQSWQIFSAAFSPSPGTPGEGWGEGFTARLHESLRSALAQSCVMARTDLKTNS